MDVQEANLIRRAQSLDEEAVTHLFERCYPKVFGFYLRRLSEPESAEDATSEVMVRMIRGLPHYRMNGAPFEAWVLRIAKNRLIDMIRSRKRRDEQTMDMNIQGRSDVEFDRVLDRESIDYALEQLNDVQREVITMRFIEGRDIDAVASAIGRSKQATKSLQFRALSAMRRALEKREARCYSEQRRTAA